MIEHTTIDGYRIEDDGERVEISNDGDPCGVKLSAGELFSFLGRHRGKITVQGGHSLPGGVVVTVPIAWIHEAVAALEAPGYHWTHALVANLKTLLPKEDR